MSAIIKPLPGTPLNKAHPLARGLVGCWLFNEHTGNVLHDYSDHGANGVLVEAGSDFSWDPMGGRFAGGSFTYFSFNQIDFDDADDWTASICLKQGSNSTNGAVIGTPGGTNQWWFNPPSYLKLVPSGGGQYDFTTMPPFNYYCHCAVAVKAGVMSAYKDGTFKESITPSHSGFSYSSIGAAYDSANYAFGGIVSHLFIYDRALSPTEIAWLHHDPYCLFEPLNFWWFFYADAAAGVTLSPAGLAHDHVIGAISLTQAHGLAVSDIFHPHALDAPTLTQAHTLSVAGLAHAQALGALVLVAGITLDLASLVHAHTLEAIALSQAHSLTVSDISHAQAINALTLSTAITLAIADIAHAHGLDTPALTQAHMLAPGGLHHNQALDATAITQAHILAINDLLHGHSLDALQLIASVLLTINSLVHTQGLDAANLSQAHVLVVDDMGHSITLDAFNLTQAHVLALTDLLHGQAIDNITLDTGQLAVGKVTVTFTAKKPGISFVGKKPGISFTAH